MDLEQLVDDFCSIIDSVGSENSNEKEKADQIFRTICEKLSPSFKMNIRSRLGFKTFRNIGDDILQDAYTGLYKSLSDPNKRWVKGKIKNGRVARFKTWAEKFVKFKSIDGYRKEKRHNRKRVNFELANDRVSSGISPLDLISIEELNLKNITAIQEISDDLTKNVLLQSIQGKRGVEIAMEFNTTPVRVSRILKKAKSYLDNRVF